MVRFFVLDNGLAMWYCSLIDKIKTLKGESNHEETDRRENNEVGSLPRLQRRACAQIGRSWY